jgi:beta-phosphoglucomutase-like phosphatase (HAD superfamily)
MPTAGPLLPDRVSTCLLDLDGVLTQTAKLHAAAWKEMSDAFCSSGRARRARRLVAGR